MLSPPIKREIRKVDKNGNEDMIIISHKIKFIDGARFVASSLSSLVENLVEGKTQVFRKNICMFGLSIIELIKTLMFEFWYDYMKPKYDDEAKVCYIDTNFYCPRKSKRHL